MCQQVITVLWVIIEVENKVFSWPHHPMGTDVVPLAVIIQISVCCDFTISRSLQTLLTCPK